MPDRIASGGEPSMGAIAGRYRGMTMKRERKRRLWAAANLRVTVLSRELREDIDAVERWADETGASDERIIEELRDTVAAEHDHVRQNRGGAFLRAVGEYDGWWRMGQ